MQRLSSETRHAPAVLLLLVQPNPIPSPSPNALPSPNPIPDPNPSPNPNPNPNQGAAAARRGRAWPRRGGRHRGSVLESALRVQRVSCDGDFDDQMSSLLVAVSSD